MPMNHGLVVALLVLAGCGDTSVPFGSATGEGCHTADRVALQPDEPGTNGLTGAQVMAFAAAAYQEVHVTWEAGSDPADEAFFFDFGDPLAHWDVDQHGDSPRCQQRQWTEVEVPVTITTASGWITATDVVRLIGLGEDQVVVWDSQSGMSATVVGRYRERVLERMDGVTEVTFGLSAHGLTFEIDEDIAQVVGIGSRFDNDQGGGTSSVYRCKGACFSLAETE